MTTKRLEYDSDADCDLLQGPVMPPLPTLNTSDMSSDNDSVDLQNESSIDSDGYRTDNDSDSDIDVQLPLKCVEPDEVCEKLSKLILSERIPKTGILYKHLKNVVSSISDPLHHEYDVDVVEFFNSVGYLGGERTVNFLVGPMSVGQGQ